MNQTDLRKAAILVSVLDTPSADALLEQMGPAADRVRAAVMQLDDVSEDEQARVIQEFMGLGANSDSDVSWDLPDPATIETEAPTTKTAAIVESTDRPFAFLADTDPVRFSEHLQRENPQLAAVVLAHLPAEQAADVLQHLPTAMATDVLIRIAQLDEMSPEVLSEIEIELRHALSPFLRTRKSKEHGAARVGAILQSLPTNARGQVETALARRDRNIVETKEPKPESKPRLRIAPETLEAEFPANRQPKLPSEKPAVAPFTELASLSDADWQQLLQAAEEELIFLAFAGAEPRFINRVLRSFSKKEAGYWRKQFAHPGPVRLRDIDAAQAQLAQLAADLTDQGILHWSARHRFAAVA